MQHYQELTTVHPVGLAAILVLGVLMLTVPRQWSLLPMVLAACFISAGQRLVVYSLDFTFLRLMVLFGVARIFLKGESRRLRWCKVDGLMIAWACAGITAYTLLHGTMSALVLRLGNAFDSVGMYFLFRLLIRDWEDVERVIMTFVLVSVPVAGAFLVERATGRNMFAALGGVPAITEMREGRLRCQGAFAHSIMAGCFWASWIPLMAALLFDPRHRKATVLLGLFCSLVIIATCASSTPVAAVLLAVIAAFVFPMRRNLRWIRWAFVATLVLLHFSMKKPVWHLVARIDLAGGSTGWHRYHLIDQAINHFGEWCLIGVRSTGHWGWGLDDLTNQYVLEGVRGGLVTLLLFVFMIGFAFQSLGRLLAARSGDRRRTVLVWALGTSLFVHCTNFIAVSYFGQIIMAWYLILAMISSLDEFETATAAPVRGWLHPGLHHRHRPA